jgi:hypothetical protein
MNLLYLNGVYGLTNLIIIEECSLKLIYLLLQGLFDELIFLLPLVVLLDIELCQKPLYNPVSVLRAE